MDGPKHENLDARLARLPQEVAVPRNLWPGIARAIERRPRRARTFAIAASLSACAVGALLWAALHGWDWKGAADPGAAHPVSASARGASFDEPRDTAYLAARTDVERSFRDRLAVLDPRTRDTIQASLAEIRRTHEELRRELVAQPSNAVLEHLLESTLNDEFDLYDSVVQGTQPSMNRS